jgi:hypothetical protein
MPHAQHKRCHHPPRRQTTWILGSDARAAWINPE